MNKPNASKTTTTRRSPSTPTKAPTVEIVDETGMTSTTRKLPSFRLSSDKVRATNGAKLSGLIADSLVKGSHYTQAIGAAAKEMRNFRLLFQAHPDVVAILGENAPDLAGRSSAYLAAWKVVREQASTEAVERMVAAGVAQEHAEIAVKGEAETFRKSVSRRYRLNIEAEAKKLGSDVGAKYLLAHGFERNGECGPNQLLTKDASLALPKSAPEGTPLSLDTVMIVLPTTAGPTGQPNEQGDQAKPGEQANASIKAANGGKLPTSPQEAANLAVGLLQGVGKDKRTGSDLSSAESKAAALNILQATSEALLALVPNLNAKDKAEVGSKLRAMLGGTVTQMELAASTN